MLVTERERLREELVELVDKHGHDRSALMSILEEVQRRNCCISEYCMQVIADLLDLHPVEVQSVVSFYSFLNEKPQGQFVIRLCRTVSCEMFGKAQLARQLKNDLGIRFGETTADGKFSLHWANCLGMCDQGPAMLVNDQVFTRVTPEKIHGILQQCRESFGVHATAGGHTVKQMTSDTRTGSLTFDAIEPGSGLTTALAKNPHEVLGEIEAAKLRGRGGAGFPTSMKWKMAAEVEEEEKYVVCNADEGEPGTFKDRVILANYADLVFEGMTIAAGVIGARQGIIYLRAEYTYLRNHLEEVLARRREQNLLGRNIGGKAGFDFDISIHMGAGAYVCGEETALIESLEGQRGEPRNRPPFPIDTGFLGHPTIVNNVETFAWVVCILAKGADWFKETGTARSTGSKLFSVSGDCRLPGVYEFPLGITIAQLLEEVGGEGAKAVQVGGASGLCVPAEQFQRTIAFEDVPTGGSVIVFGPTRDMLKVAENFLEFFIDESCGQCTPCREGVPKLIDGVRKLQMGQCSMAYLKELCSLGETLQLAAKCGLGQASPNALLSIVEHFQDEILGRTLVEG
jgi:[NiFe] hydrogenase diaphorase moiety large subunit